MLTVFSLLGEVLFNVADRIHITFVLLPLSVCFSIAIVLHSQKPSYTLAHKRTQGKMKVE